jgi:5'-3' exonuclease
MCILCGCDYASKIEGIGPVKAYKFIKEYSTIENLIEFCKSENEK